MGAASARGGPERRRAGTAFLVPPARYLAARAAFILPLLVLCRFAHFGKRRDSGARVPVLFRKRERKQKYKIPLKKKKKGGGGTKNGAVGRALPERRSAASSSGTAAVAPGQGRPRRHRADPAPVEPAAPPARGALRDRGREGAPQGCAALRCAVPYTARCVRPRTVPSLGAAPFHAVMPSTGVFSCFLLKPCVVPAHAERQEADEQYRDVEVCD